MTVKLSGQALSLFVLAPGCTLSEAGLSRVQRAHSQEHSWSNPWATWEHGNNSPQGKSKPAPCGMDLLC